MKNKPLKNKSWAMPSSHLRELCIKTDENFIYLPSDVKSAVEWLKERLWKFHTDYGALSTDFTLKEIDKAFPDLIHLPHKESIRSKK